MKQNKRDPIGIIDGGVEGIDIFEKLQKTFPKQEFIYINDLKNYPYEEKDIEEINGLVKKNIDILLSFNIRLLLVVNNSIIEYCDEYLNTLKIPVIKINDLIIDYVNTNYEHKNILFMAKQYLIKTNIYQKNIHYAHLYNINSDEIETIILQKKARTQYSFAKVKELLKQMNSKEINFIVFIDSYLQNLRLEFNEYIETKEIIDIPTICTNEVQKIFKNDVKSRFEFNQKGKIITSLKKKDFVDYVYWLNGDYKYIDIKKRYEYVEMINIKNNVNNDNKEIKDNN